MLSTNVNVMRYVDRTRIPEPEIFSSDKLRKLRRKTADLARDKTSNKRIRFYTTWYREVRGPLNELFFSKCCYCETSLLAAREDIELFRPKASAMQLDGRIDFGYWWLAHEWRNFYIACAECNRRFKKNRFPVKGRRAASIKDLDKENTLLIDPCREGDFRSQNFAYRYHPDVQEIEMVGLSSKGEISVEILGLNRSELRRRRAKVWQNVDHFIEIFRQGDASELGSAVVDMIRSSLAPDAEYSDMASRLLQEHKHFHHLASRIDLTDLPGSYKEAVSVPPPRAAAVNKRQKDHAERQTAYSVFGETKEQKERYFGALKNIERVELRNFRAFDHLDLTIPIQGVEDEASWLALIGENATGKSSILKAIALTLMGKDERSALNLDPDDFVMRGRTKATVSVSLTNIDQPLVLTIERKPAKFTCTVEEPLVLILGYGATRLLRSFNESASTERQLIRINNLFDPYQKLNHVEKWLADTSAVSAKRFKLIREALMDLLLLDPNVDDIKRSRGRVYVSLAGDWRRLDQLSDGYQSIVALALDIMRVVVEKWQSISDSEGIVLIDELDVHLHPRWRMQITRRLRSTFPGMQIIVTTHDPLCLRGCREGEVILMRRDKDTNRVEAVTKLPSPEAFRVDQLLTSSFFGLNSSMDPESEALFNEYHLLLAVKRPTKVQAARVSELQVELKDLGHLGSTPRDEIMYEVIDRLLARDRHDELDRPIEELKEEAVNSVAELWKERFAASK
jgi:hypothetical protein